MKKIKLVLGGGLGNQLFQYAAYLYIKETFPKTELCLDMFQYKYDAYHNGIEFQKIFATEFDEKINRIECFRNNKKISKRYPTMFHTLKNKILGYRTFYEDSINNPDKMNKVISQYNKCIFAGFYQNPLFIENIDSLLRSLYKNNQVLGSLNEKIINKIDAKVSVSLHIRRGDYLNISKYDVFNGLSYYENAINFFNHRFSNVIYVVFSNDIEWVKNNLKVDGEYIYVDWNTNENSYKDMLLMSKCNHNIIANSSFSWWGAWLNENSEKIVFAPKYWFKGILSQTIIPSTWKIIDC